VSASVFKGRPFVPVLKAEGKVVAGADWGEGKAAAGCDAVVIARMSERREEGKCMVERVGVFARRENDMKRMWFCH
jgi:hypothetical protein